MRRFPVAKAGLGSAILALPCSAAPVWWERAAFAAWGGLIAVLLLAAAMTTGITYDEDQHIAAGVLARHLRPYADFVYLQPPLYPLLLSVVFGVADGHYLLAGAC